MNDFLKLEEGQTRLGAFLSEIAAPNLLRIYKTCGLDYVIIDCEHGYFSHAQVAALAAVANGIGLMAMVRVLAASPETRKGSARWSSMPMMAGQGLGPPP